MNVVLVSRVQQSDSAMHRHISVLFQLLFPHRLLQNPVQSSLQQVFVDDLFCRQSCVYVHFKLLIYLPPLPFPFENHKFVFETWFVLPVALAIDNG